MAYAIEGTVSKIVKARNCGNIQIQGKETWYLKSDKLCVLESKPMDDYCCCIEM